MQSNSWYTLFINIFNCSWNILIKYKFLKPIKISKLIRMSEKFNGEYVIDSNIIKNSNNLISLGLGSDCSFELNYLRLKNN